MILCKDFKSPNIKIQRIALICVCDGSLAFYNTRVHRLHGTITKNEVNCHMKLLASELKIARPSSTGGWNWTNVFMSGMLPLHTDTVGLRKYLLKKQVPKATIQIVTRAHEMAGDSFFSKRLLSNNRERVAKTNAKKKMKKENKNNNKQKHKTKTKTKNKTKNTKQKENENNNKKKKKNDKKKNDKKRKKKRKKKQKEDAAMAKAVKKAKAVMNAKRRRRRRRGDSDLSSSSGDFSSSRSGSLSGSSRSGSLSGSSRSGSSRSGSSSASSEASSAADESEMKEVSGKRLKPPEGPKQKKTKKRRRMK